MDLIICIALVGAASGLLISLLEWDCWLNDRPGRIEEDD